MDLEEDSNSNSGLWCGVETEEESIFYPGTLESMETETETRSALVSMERSGAEGRGLGIGRGGVSVDTEG